jgi:hypothetical protein
MGTRSACEPASQGRYSLSARSVILKKAVPVFDEIMLNSKRWSGMTIRGKVIALEEISSQPHRAFS